MFGNIQKSLQSTSGINLCLKNSRIATDKSESVGFVYYSWTSRSPTVKIIVMSKTWKNFHTAVFLTGDECNLQVQKNVLCHNTFFGHSSNCGAWKHWCFLWYDFQKIIIDSGRNVELPSQAETNALVPILLKWPQSGFIFCIFY